MSAVCALATTGCRPVASGFPTFSSKTLDVPVDPTITQGPASGSGRKLQAARYPHPPLVTVFFCNLTRFV
jgi:hypothetical protein